MKRFVRLAVATSLAAGMTVGISAEANAAAGDVSPMVALTDDNGLVPFSTGTDAFTDDTIEVQGLDEGETLLGIDVRPANGKLYGVTDESQLYVIDVATGIASQVGNAPFAPEIDFDGGVGFDFNPTVDRIRLTTDAGQNLRLNPNTGALATEDVDLAFKSTTPADTNSGDIPEVVASAYTNPVFNATATTLFNIEANNNVLVTQAPPNDGVLNTVGTGGLGADFGSDAGMDIDADNVAYASNGNDIFNVNLATGATTPAANDGFDDDIIDIAASLPEPDGLGYSLAASDGGVFNYGSSTFAGSAGGAPINQPVVGTANHTTGDGYWLAAADGGVFSYGDAKFAGSAGGAPINQPVVGIASHPSNNGYWLVARDGGVFAYGDAKFFGSAGGAPINKPVVGMASTPTGNGYWLFAADGGVFSYGDATFFGSAGETPINQPVVGGAASTSGAGYYLVAADGGVFNYGPDATFVGSAGGAPINQPVVGMAADLDGLGYWLVARDGGVFSYDAEFLGSAGATPLNRPIVGMSAN